MRRTETPPSSVSEMEALNIRRPVLQPTRGILSRPPKGNGQTSASHLGVSTMQGRQWGTAFASPPSVPSLFSSPGCPSSHADGSASLVLCLLVSLCSQVSGPLYLLTRTHPYFELPCSQSPRSTALVLSQTLGNYSSPRVLLPDKLEVGRH